MIVTLANQQQDLTVNENNVPLIVEAVIDFEGHKTDEVSVNFVDSSVICDLHKQYFNDPSLTDCISFPIDAADEDHYSLLGEIFVCPLAAINYATLTGSDPYDEVLLYLVHGLLHLMNYDDIEENDKKVMREAEKRHLAHLKSLNLDLRKK